MLNAAQKIIVIIAVLAILGVTCDYMQDSAKLSGRTNKRSISELEGSQDRLYVSVGAIILVAIGAILVFHSKKGKKSND